MTRKNICLLLICLLFVGVPCITRAADRADMGVKSEGNIFYESSAGSVKLYGEDILLLREKLASIPEDIFDPVLYSHTHQWEFVDITQNTHKKHCTICGSIYDVVNLHSAISSRVDYILYGENEYLGYEKICECGYKWKEEMYHNMIYKAKDEMYHTVSCALSGTQYCNGMQSQEVPHEFFLNPTDSTHHQNVCACGYSDEPVECIFNDEITMEDSESVEARKYCVCGNYIIDVEEETEPERSDPETDEDSEETKKGPEMAETIDDATQRQDEKEEKNEE